ncbi:hypothetical protein [Synechocystis sp. PCC 6714]|uniref:hypothetical protein n=1 Tax=Synechocystis sp. (strain PCC 6714) TaxID=1147 RepID=UPI00040C9679|nr:hypothetical protein [Synechocystis sp. PCC 6714]AIE74885.1 hypothetical protein D082_23570 [Synechocystis sp. PCC 6714]
MRFATVKFAIVWYQSFCLTVHGFPFRPKVNSAIAGAQTGLRLSSAVVNEAQEPVEAEITGI